MGWSRKAKISIHDKALILCAGPAAEARYWGRWRPMSMFGDLKDLKALIGQEQYSDFFHTARIQVKFYWPVIQAVAAELLKAGTLSGNAAERIVNEAWQQQRKDG